MSFFCHKERIHNKTKEDVMDFFILAGVLILAMATVDLPERRTPILIRKTNRKKSVKG